MADNYLEKRMEELRSGKLGVKKSIPGIRQNALRVLVVGGCHGVAKEKALEFRKQRCRVAIFDENEETGKRMAYEHGIRYHHTDIGNATDIAKELESLLRAWRNIDIAIGDKDTCSIIENTIAKWKDNLPIADKSALEIVIINEITQS
ncbi:MAG: hypothetical protein K2K25_11995 [Muribaculaceae bacterium]|nr:hypothetical protein [Muribaculaceae bacterium]